MVLDLQNRWPEYSALVLLIVGFIFAIMVVNSKFMLFMMVFLWGMIFGRLWHTLKSDFKFPWALLVVGFLIGYLLASIVLGYGSLIINIILYFAGFLISYYIHEKRVLQSTEY